MKRPFPILGLLRFWAGSVPWSGWLLPAIYLVLCATRLIELFGPTTVGRSLSIYILIVYVYLLGMQQFGKGRLVGPRTGKSGLPCAEFILTRPFPRRQVHAFFVSLFLALVLIPALIAVAFAVRHPDLSVRLQPPDRRAGRAG